MDKEKLKTYAALFIVVFGGVTAVLLFFRYVFVWLLPFLVAWGTAFLVRPIAKRLSRVLRTPERLLRVVLSILLLFTLIGVGGVLVWQLAAAVWRFISDVGNTGAIHDFFYAIINPSFGILGGIEIPPELSAQLDGAFNSAVSEVLSSAAELLTKWAAVIPKMFVAIVITVIATVYFAFELEKINSCIKRLLPPPAFNALVRVKNSFITVGVKYIRSYSIVMLITFALMLVGFFILRVPHAPLIALLVALLDLLPVIGVGTVLLPWSIFAFITGESTLGIGLAVLFLVNEIVRQFAEPKIIGKNLGVHPLLTLLLLYAGFGLFGFAGMLLLPLLAAVVGLFVKNDTTEVE